jgi:hypothetical protein
MKKTLLCLSLLILSFAIKAQVLGVDRTEITMGSSANIEKFDLCSDTTWTVVTSQSWLKVIVYLWYGNTHSTSMGYSGSAPDIGYSEFINNTGAGRDSAFIKLIADANTSTTRTAMVTITGMNVPVIRTITVTQTGIGEKVTKMVMNNGSMIIKSSNTIINKINP